MTVSDSRGPENDLSGNAIEQILREHGAESVVRNWCRDGADEVASALESLTKDVDVLLTTGGTGMTPRDQTPEGTLRVVDRLAPGIAELVRAKGANETPFSWISRGIAGLRGTTLIVNLPGSVGGASSGTRALIPLLPHVVDQLRGGKHHDGSN